MQLWLCGCARQAEAVQAHFRLLLPDADNNRDGNTEHGRQPDGDSRISRRPRFYRVSQWGRARLCAQVKM